MNVRSTNVNNVMHDDVVTGHEGVVIYHSYQGREDDGALQSRKPVRTASQKIEWGSNRAESAWSMNNAGSQCGKCEL